MGKIRDRGKRRVGLTRIDGTVSTKIPPAIEHPVFCLHYLDKKYCLSKCDQVEKASFADKLRVLSQQTWGEITTNRPWGYEKIKDRRSLSRNVPKGITEDLPIITFYFHDKKKMVGCRNSSVFHIVWLDRDFSLYDHGG